MEAITTPYINAIQKQHTMQIVLTQSCPFLLFRIYTETQLKCNCCRVFGTRVQFSLSLLSNKTNNYYYKYNNYYYYYRYSLLDQISRQIPYIELKFRPGETTSEHKTHIYLSYLRNLLNLLDLIAICKDMHCIFSLTLPSVLYAHKM